MAIARMSRSVTPLLTAVQLAPPLAETKMPPPKVPTYTKEGLEGLISRARTLTDVRPVFMAVQLVPPLVDLKTPVSNAPAYTVVGVVGSIRTAWIWSFTSPMVQLVPPLVVL